MADPAANHSPKSAMPPSDRLAMLRALASIASSQVTVQLDAFAGRLSDALSKLSDQTVRSDDADVGRNALHHLNRNKLSFHRLVSSSLTELLSREIVSVDTRRESKPEREAMDLSLVTFEAMEHKVLIDNLTQALDNANSDTLGALNLRLARLLQREDIGAQNPFRPEIFLKAISDAWSRFDLNPASHLLIVRQMRPEIFLQLEPVFQALNDALIAHGILPDLKDAYRLKKSDASVKRPVEAERRNLPLYGKLQRWLSPATEATPGTGLPGHGGGAQGGSIQSDILVHPGLVGYLSNLQKQSHRAVDAGVPVEVNTSVLRQIRAQAPPGTLTQADANAIELLARTFDYLFQEQYIPAAIKQLLAQLQIPLLKAALTDREFFFSEAHPARRFLDAVAKSSVACDQDKGHDDPLFKMIERVVERVQQEYDQQIELFDAVVTDLESFVAQEAKASGDALSQAIAEAARQERINHAKDLAENDVAVRIDTGEVAGFVEVFLETQWTRILGLAYSVQEAKPEVLESAIKTMDDLIWSVKPKTSPEERKELVSRLPSLLSMVNAWLNVVKWEGPDRVAFFSTLAERHAAIVRTAVELSPRHQLEITLNAAQKASERHLDQRASALPEKIIDKYTFLVDDLEPDTWIEFLRSNGTRARFKLAWISPKRTRFVFANRQGQEPFTFSFDELAQSLRDQNAVIVAAEAIVDRALAAALEEVGPT